MKILIAAAVVAAFVVGLVAVLGEEDQRPTPGPAPRTGLPSPAAPLPTVTPAPAPTGGCAFEEDFPVELTMRYDDGLVNDDLVMCTDAAQTESLVKNASTSTVYFLAGGGGYAYWPPEEDAAMDAEVRLFRISLRYIFEQQGQQPYLTLEPGQRIDFEEPPAGLSFQTDEQEQAAWQAAVLHAALYEQAKAQVFEQAEDYFQRRRPAGLAAVLCTKAAYDAGRTVGGAVDDPSAVLFRDVYDDAEGTAGCVTALRDVERASEQEGRAPVISRQALRQAGQEPGWTSSTDDVLRFVARRGTQLAQAVR